MATDWIKMRGSMRRNAKVVAMSRQLACDRAFMNWWSDPVRKTCNDCVTELVTFQNVTRVTVCGLLDVWSEVNSVIQSDDIVTFMTLQDIDDIAEIPGFGEAMESVGWVVETEDGSLKFPNFKDFNTPESIRKQPLTDAERAKKYREKKQKKRHESVTNTVTNTVTKNVTKRHENHGIKRREEKKESTTYSPPPPPTAGASDGGNGAQGLPPPLDTPQFRAAWERWLTHRKELRKRVTPTTAESQLRNLEHMGHDRAIAAIEHSIANGWQGIFEPDRPGPGPAGQTDRQRAEARRGVIAENLKL